ncbi:MAG TPA: pyruvate:ferredoxin (flavodoxin) oxidoreductase, partial [Chthonomonadaceae bacterium]|nr:pyruvate:ferredoxin (flavodoxin) oxidoreductase [Chthonomonadaceae bacterium]
DSKKSGSITISHLRFGPRPIHSAYLIQKASFVAIHQFDFLERYPVLDAAEPGATVLLNSPYGPEEVWERLPVAFRKQVLAKQLQLYVLDGHAVAKETGMGGRVNTIMQTAFFALSDVLPQAEAIAQIKAAIRKTYSKRGEAVVRQNHAAVDAALAHLHSVRIPDTLNALPAEAAAPSVVPEDAPEFVRRVTAEIMAGRGDLLPVSALPADGTYPSGTAQWEKRNIALESPVWEPDLCIQCGKCMLVCPHGVIRAKVCEETALAGAPETFKTMPAKFKEFPGQLYTIQVSVADCTGCTLCVEVCPAKDKSKASRKALNMAPQRPLREPEGRNWEFFLGLPDAPRNGAVHFNSIKNVQLLQPLFEFSGACAGCGETPYLKLLSQLFGDRALVANATGCSSIYGGNLPTTPWTKNREGRGPAWSNSLFEDNAEFGLGMRLTLEHQTRYALQLLNQLSAEVGPERVEALLTADQATDAGIAAQREWVAALKQSLEGNQDPRARDLLAIADVLVQKSVWIVGGDGWAYDIGYGGLDHVLASGYNVNLLVLDTEVYSNTGGQASKATARGAVAKFASSGKSRPKKDLGRMAMAYGNVYVAQVALGAKDQHVVRAFLEAEAYEGPSLIIAYSPCIAHGIDMARSLDQQKLAVESGYWPLYRYNPDLAVEGKTPFQLDSAEPSIALEDYIYTEGRYRILQQSDPARARRLLQAAQEDVRETWRAYKQMAASSQGAEIQK